MSLRPGNGEGSGRCAAGSWSTIQYDRNDMDFKRGCFRVRGDVMEIISGASGSECLIRVEFFGDEIDRITEIDALTGRDAKDSWSMSRFSRRPIMLCRRSRLSRAAMNIEKELEEQVRLFQERGQASGGAADCRTDEFRYRNAAGNRILFGYRELFQTSDRMPEPGTPPCTLMDYFPDDFLIIMDESHMTIPQIRGMYAGDRSRKTDTGGLWLPSAVCAG